MSSREVNGVLCVCQGFSTVGHCAELAEVCVRKSSHAHTLFGDEALGDHLVITKTNLDTVFIKRFCVHNLF